MASILITAFEPYDQWVENSSWLALMDFTKNIETSHKVTTRLYPVNFEEVRRRLQKDLDANHDYVLHLGQAPGLGAIRLEAIGVNVGGSSKDPPERHRKLVNDGPVAYHSKLPLVDWVEQLREAGVPASVSFHAGTLLCNATLYMTHYLVEKMSLQTRATFVHLPLATRQVANRNKEMASLPVATSANALHLIVGAITKLEPQYDPKLV
jgi:pyroglutamyl-peptidase